MPTRVAIVDDHRLVREGLKRVLDAQEDLQVVGECGTGSEVSELIFDCAPDVLLLDVTLPDVDGLTLIAKIRETRPEMHVLVLTMHSEAEYAAAAVERGASGLIGKDASSERLLGAIRTVAAGRAIPVERTLSSREREILDRIAAGASNEQIAEDLGIRVKTVEGHCERLMKKLDIHTRAGLVAYGRRLPEI